MGRRRLFAGARIGSQRLWVMTVPAMTTAAEPMRKRRLEKRGELFIRQRLRRVDF